MYFSSFLILALCWLTDNTPTHSEIFSTMQLLNFLRLYVIQYAGNGIAYNSELYLLFFRTCSILTLPEYQTEHQNKNNSKDKNFPWNQKNKNRNRISNLPEINYSIHIKDFYGLWQASPDEEIIGVQNIHFTFEKGKHYFVCGKTGQGKSSLLLSILHELPFIKGILQVNGSIAFVEQSPYIFPQTIKENILFGQDYQQNKYDSIIKVCELENDFKLLSDGDETKIQMNDTVLSSGQKARISLASDADIVLIDDCLIAIDQKLLDSIFMNAIKIQLCKKTVILCSTELKFASKMDFIIVKFELNFIFLKLMDQGKIISSGPFAQMQEKVYAMLGKQLKTKNKNLLETRRASMLKFQMSALEKKQIVQFQQKLRKNNLLEIRREISKMESSIIAPSQDQIIPYEPGQITSQSTMQDVVLQQFAINTTSDEECIVNWQTYHRFISEFLPGKYFYLLIVIFATISAQTAGILYIRWPEQIGIQGILVLIILSGRIIASILVIILINKGAGKLHFDMLTHFLFASPITIEGLPPGKVLNRFSSDLGVIDGQLCPALIEYIDSIIRFTATLLYTLYIQPLLAIQGTVLLIAYIFLLIFIKRVQEESKRLDLQYKGPLFTFLINTIQGIMNIRIYKQNKKFEKKFQRLCENHARAKFNFWYVFRTASFFFELLATLCAIVGVFITIEYSKENQTNILGQALIYLVFLTQYIQATFRQILHTSNVMNSTERCFKYIDLPTEYTVEQKLNSEGFHDNNHSILTTVYPINENEIKTMITEDNWIKSGEIVFDNVHFKFQQNASTIIRGITCRILPQENVAIVGRTGCGKSALIQTLFRLGIMDNQNEESRGQIRIDGIDIQQISAKLLRKNLSILPQKPFIFSRNFRENIDPLKQYTDQQIIEVLKELQLDSVIFNLNDQLEAPFSEVIKKLSFGQRYLISLARIFLGKTQIIIIDEATANLDMQTDEIIQKFIRQKFAHHTILTIAHRLFSIADYDKVAVMNEGQIIEFGRPFKLLTLNDSDLMITRNSTFAEMVKYSGELTALGIFEIAKEKHLNQRRAFNMDLQII